jgi:hypothetical protein
VADVSTISTTDIAESPEVRELYERLGYMNGVEALRELAKAEWWVRDAVLWRYGR